MRYFSANHIGHRSNILLVCFKFIIRTLIGISVSYLLSEIGGVANLRKIFNLSNDAYL